jgi:hypothetical protein
MATFQSKEINLQEINNGKRFENGNLVPENAINAPIEAAYRVQEIFNTCGQSYSAFGEVGSDNTVPIYAYIEYVRIANKKGTLKITCNIPQNTSQSWGVCSTSKINSLFNANHGFGFYPTGQRTFAFLSDYTQGGSTNVAGYAPLAEWNANGIEIGRVHKTSGEFGSFVLGIFSGVFHAEFTVSEV